jgi:hypothetical protein
MSKLFIQTQVYENYGAHDWDGTGICPNYWKAKGGRDYMVPLDNRVKGGEFFHVRCEQIIDELRSRVEESNQYFQETIIGWEIVDDDFMTEFEKQQLDYMGSIDHPAEIITL